MTKVNDINFSDIYLMPEGRAYIADGKTPHGLEEIAETEDLKRLYAEIEKTWQESNQNSSYSFKYDGFFYRVERTLTNTGVQYCARRMPKLSLILKI